MTDIRVTTLPDFPWDRLVPYKDQAASHPDGIVDLSVGTPVDDTPKIAQDALASAADSPGYPLTHGTPELRKAAIDFLQRRFGVIDLDEDAVLPTMDAKELVAWLPFTLGIGPGDTIIIPETAYPTYQVGGLLAGASVVTSDHPHGFLPYEKNKGVRLVWLNSPANPTGRIWPADHLKAVVDWARANDVIVVSDECYLEFAWDAEPISILHPDVCGGSAEGLLSVHSMSKRSNLAGYRAGFVTGDREHVERLLAVRKHAGMIVPRPVQEAMTAVLGDDTHVDEQRARYAERRALLRAAFESANFDVDFSEGSLYLWATRGESCWDTVRWCAERGILVTPGDFYGAAGARHVRVAFTATDERVGAATKRLTER